MQNFTCKRLHASVFFFFQVQRIGLIWSAKQDAFQYGNILSTSIISQLFARRVCNNSIKFYHWRSTEEHEMGCRFVCVYSRVADEFDKRKKMSKI